MLQGIYHDKHMKKKDLVEGSVVFCKAHIGWKDSKLRKFSPNSQGSYIIDTKICLGMYKQRRGDGIVIPNIWHVDNIRKYYAQ